MAWIEAPPLRSGKTRYRVYRPDPSGKTHASSSDSASGSGVTASECANQGGRIEGEFCLTP
jgi:hypothetical protein